MQRLQVLCPAHRSRSVPHPQVQMDPTRTITNDLLSATLVDYGFCYPVNRPCLDCRLLTFRLEGP